MKRAFCLGACSVCVQLAALGHCANAQSLSRVRDIHLTSSGISSSSPSVPVGLVWREESDARLLFAAASASTGSELWISDGTTLGTVLLADVAPGVASSSPVPLMIVNNTLYFAATRAGVEGEELWKINLSSASPVATLAWDINTGTADGAPRNPVLLGSTLVFSAVRPGTGREMCYFDTTTQTGGLLVDAASGIATSSMTAPVVAGDEVWFIAGSFGRELFRSRGTAATTVRVADLSSVATAGITSLMIAGPDTQNSRVLPSTSERIFMPVRTASQGVELWRSDGTLAGTSIVTDLYPGSSGSTPTLLGVAGGKLYFSAIQQATARELLTIGPLQSTPTLIELQPGSTGSNPDQILELADGRVLVTASRTVATANVGKELFISDGTAAGTNLLIDLIPGSLSSSPDGLFDVGGNVILCAALSNASPTTVARELWKITIPPIGSASLPAGAMLSSVPTEGFRPAGMTRLGNQVVFSADDGSTGRELWSVFMPPPCAAPSILAGPVGGVWYEPGPIRLEVSTSGSGPLQYQWFKDGSELLDDGFTITGAQSRTLDLNPVFFWHAGTYTVRVSNACGESNSASVEVTVLPPAVCDSLDFNNDGNIDPLDVDCYFSVLGEGPCLPEWATCNDLDFNNDGNIEPADVDSYFSILGEGPCIPG